MVKRKKEKKPKLSEYPIEVDNPHIQVTDSNRIDSQTFTSLSMSVSELQMSIQNLTEVIKNLTQKIDRMAEIQAKSSSL